MKTVAVSNLRENLPSYLKEVEAGEELLVVSRGHEIARIVPVEDRMEKARQKLAKLRRTCAKVGDVVSPIAEPWEADG